MGRPWGRGRFLHGTESSKRDDEEMVSIRREAKNDAGSSVVLSEITLEAARRLR